MKLNTKQSGVARVIIFPVKGKYKAVCLDFDIIKEAKTRQEVEAQIKESIEGYIINIFKNNLDTKLLNRNAPKKYWDMYYKYEKFVLASSQIKNNIPLNLKESSFFAIPISELLKDPVYLKA